MKTGKSEMQPIMLAAFALLGLVALVPVAYLALAPDPVPVYLGPGQQTAVATPNHDPNRMALPQPAAVEPEIVAAALPPAPIAPTVGPAPAAAAVSPPTLESIAQQAGPEPGTPSVPTFVTTDTKLYARDNARLRAAPSTIADIVATLDADAPLRATARSTDGVWWRVPLGDGRLAYVHKTAVTRNLVAKAKPNPKPAGASTPIVAVAPAQPAPSRRNDGFLGYVDQTVDWFVETAARGSPPTLTRPER